LKIAMYAADR